MTWLHEREKTQKLWYFEKNIFFLNIYKSRIKLCFHNKKVEYSWKLHGKVNYLIKTGVFFSLVGYYLRPSNNYRPLIFNINVAVLMVITC